MSQARQSVSAQSKARNLRTFALSRDLSASRLMDSLASPPVLLTASETAALLRVDRRTVWRWGATGRLGAVRLGPNTVRYRRASVEALIGGSLPLPTTPTTPVKEAA